MKKELIQNLRLKINCTCTLKRNLIFISYFDI